MVAFDLSPLAAGDIRQLLLDGLGGEDMDDPFWVYSRLVEDVVDRQDRTVGLVRDLVRWTEKGRRPSEGRRPDFFQLHAMARHAIHVSETLELGTILVDGILVHQRRIVGSGTGAGTGPDEGMAVANCLTFSWTCSAAFTSAPPPTAPACRTRSSSPSTRWRSTTRASRSRSVARRRRTSRRCGPLRS